MKTKPKVITDVPSFTIRRSKWARGGKKGSSALLNSQGNMCCLGFYSKACGFTKENIQHIIAPDRIPVMQNYSEAIKFKSKLIKYRDYPNTTKICDDLMDINDDQYITDKVREEKLTKKFSKMGVKVTFTK